MYRTQVKIREDIIVIGVCLLKKVLLLTLMLRLYLHPVNIVRT